MEKIVSNYLSLLNIPISRRYTEKLIASHPEYPSLLSITDSLEGLGINFKIGEVENDIEGVSLPCVFQLDRRGGELLLIKEQSDLEAHRPDLKHWNGIVLKAEAKDTIPNLEHIAQYLREKRQQKFSTALSVALAGLFLLPVVTVSSWLPLLFWVTAAAGAMVGYLLLAKDLGITYKPVENFCNAGTRTNCDRILNAEDATLFGVFNFTDAAASYFGFQLFATGLVLPLTANSGPFWWGLAAATALTLPVIGYSLYYQQFKARIWCRLCLIVEGILIVQAGLIYGMYVSGLFTPADVALLPLLIFLSILTAILAVVVLFKNRVEAANENARAETAAKRVKFDPEVFWGLLLKGNRIGTGPLGQEMRLGMVEAPIQVLMVVNLHCHPCSVAFKTVNQLIQTYPDKISFTIRLLNSRQNTIGNLPVSSYLLRYWQHHIWGQQDEEVRTQQLWADWYRDMDPKSFARRYPANGELTGKSNDLEIRHHRWITTNNITRTPTFFINRYKMPKNYQINDLVGMVPGLAAIFTEQPKTGLMSNELGQNQEG